MKYQLSRHSKLLVLIGTIAILACVDYASTAIYSIFYPEVSERPAKSDFYFFTIYYPYGISYWDYEPHKDIQNENLKEWRTYLANKFTHETLEKEIYGSEGISKEFAASLKKMGFNDACNYLVLTKELDKAIPAVDLYSWDEPQKPDNKAILAIMNKMEKKIKETNDTFFKVRYLYQLMKATGTIEDYYSMTKLYEKYFPTADNKTIISDLIASRYAGAFYHLGQNDKAYYYFAQTLSTRPKVAEMANQSVKVYDIPFSNQILRHCKSDNEKANVYVLLALQNNADITHCLEQIYRYSPNHHLLQLVVTRAINQLEHYYYSTGDDDKYYYSSYYNQDVDKPRFSLTKEQAEKQFSKLKQIVNNISTQKGLDHQNFFLLANAYLSYMNKDYKKATENLNFVKNTTNNPFVEKQKKLLEVVITLATHPQYDDNKFTSVYNNIEYLTQHIQVVRDQSAIKFVSEVLNKYFEQQGSSQNNPGRQLLAMALSKLNPYIGQKNDEYRYAYAYFDNDDNSTFDPYYNYRSYEPFYVPEVRSMLESAPIDQLTALIRIFEDKNRSSLDDKLIRLTHVQADDVYQAYGRKMMRLHNFDIALNTFKKIDKAYLKARFTTMYETPDLRLKSQKPKVIKDPLLYIESIIQLQNKVKANAKDAESSYKLAEALINISYYGQAWHLSRSHRSIYDPYDFDNDDNVLKMSISAEDKNYFYVEKAISLLDQNLASSKDNELNAKIAFLKAFIEKEMYFSLYADNEPYDENEAIEYRKSIIGNRFSTLYNKYRNTQYGKMVLRECFDFADAFNK